MEFSMIILDNIGYNTKESAIHAIEVLKSNQGNENVTFDCIQSSNGRWFIYKDASKDTELGIEEQTVPQLEDALDLVEIITTNHGGKGNVGLRYINSSWHLYWKGEEQQAALGGTGSVPSRPAGGAER